MSKTTRNAASSKAQEHPLPMPVQPLSGACQDLRMSVDRFCLLAGIEALDEMLAAITPPTKTRPKSGRDASERLAAFPRKRWPQSSECAQGAGVKIARPRVRALGGGELSLPSFELLSDLELL